MDISAFRSQFGAQTPGPVPVDWRQVESWLGLTLPSDYKAILSAFGPLDIGEFVWLHGPCVQPGRFDYADWLKETHRLCRICSRNAPPHEPPPFHPAVGGLLAWGHTRSSSYLFWDTGASEDSDQWPIVLFDLDAAENGVMPWLRTGLTLQEFVPILFQSGVMQPRGERLGPLPAVARRTAFLREATQWSPPEPEPEIVPADRRRAALTEGSGLEALRVLIPPPDTPYLGGGTWDQLFAEFGTRLPAEYVALLDCYGAGIWCGELCFITPLRRDGRGLYDRATELLGWYREHRADYPEFHPLPVWPERGGFLPFASSTDGDEVGWLTEGDPNDWPLIVYPRHHDQGPPLTGSLTATLLVWVRGRFSAPGFPGLDELDDPLEFAKFESWDDESYW